MHGPPTLPPPQKYLALPNPRSNSDSVFHHAFAPRQRLPQRMETTTSHARKPPCRIAIPIETAIHLRQRLIEAAIRCQMAMRHGGFYATWSLWKTLSGSECAMEDAIGNVMSRYIGTFATLDLDSRPGGCERRGWSRKSGGPCK